MTDVVAALIWDGDRFLACQRPANKPRALLWEFVGGKTEPGETLEEALIRECQEELAITVKPEEIFMEVIHEYPDITVRLTLFNATIARGVPQMLEHNDIRWITTDQIDDFQFCPADKDILLVLKRIHSHLQARLYACRDERNKAFQLPLMPGMDAERVIGVRMPVLRRLAKEMQVAPAPHRYYEEDCLYGIQLSNQKDYAETIRALNAFLPYVDNWAVCDLISPKSFRNPPQELMDQVINWLHSDHPYTVRYAIGVLMKFYLDSGFSPKQAQMVADIRSQHYYVNMMAAWYFATALAKQYDSVIGFLTARKLNPWVHNKTIQKACESYRITEPQKAFLRTLKIKAGGKI